MSSDEEIRVLRSILADALEVLRLNSCPANADMLQARLDRLDAKLEGDDQ
jgi:hypothetical protein